MKRQMMQEVIFCDRCSKKTVITYVCRHCNKELCYDCGSEHGRKFLAAIGTSSGYDGYYCIECNDKLSLSKDDKLYNSYLELLSLKEEDKIFNEDFSKRSNLVANRIEVLVDNLDDGKEINNE